MTRCPVCDDTGLLLQDPCPLCDGNTASADYDAGHSSGSSGQPVECSGGAGRVRQLRQGGFFDGEHAASATSAGVAELAQRLRRGELSHIIVCTGAGISVSSGIPDFRSSGGLFEDIRALLGDTCPEVMQSPETALSRGFATRFPEAHARVAKLFDRELGLPGDCHLLLALLAKRGHVQRVYTQNVDGMHQRAGLPPSLVVEAHGSLARGDEVLYGDALPAALFEAIAEDFPANARAPDQCDLMLVIGSSLQVAPFCAVPNLAQRKVPRVLVTRNAMACNRNAYSKTGQDGYYGSSAGCDSDMKFGGRQVTLAPQWGGSSKYRQQWVFDADVDEWARGLAAACGWMDQLEALRKTVSAALKPDA